MSVTLTDRLQNLSPAKRALLEIRLKGGADRLRNPFLLPLRSDSDPAALSFNQESLLFLEQLNPNTPTYNLSDAKRLRGNLNLRALQKSLDLIVERHESLRMTFREIDGQPRQIIAPSQPVSIKTIDLSILPQAEREQKALEQIAADVNLPMDLRDGPLIRVNLISVDDRENILLVTMHHIISDGWSFGLFWKEFAECYQSLKEGRTPEFPELQIQFGDYSVWSRDQLEKDLTRQTEYWKDQLGNAPALLELPTDRPRPAVQSFRGAAEVSTLPVELLEALKKISLQENTTLFMTLLAAYKLLLTRYTGQQDLVVGSPIAGRNITETENLIGFFVNTLALRTDVSGNPTFRELLSRIRNTTLDAFSHQDLPFDKVVAALRPERSLSHNPIYQVAFALQTYSNTESVTQIADLQIEPVEIGSVSAKFDLFLSTKEVKNGLELTVEYSTDLFDSETIGRLISHYKNILKTITTGIDRRVSDFDFLSENERRQLLVEWNDTATIFPDLSLNELFEIQAARNPDNIAVSSNDGDLTYRRLNALSNQIGNFLRKSGVSPNMPVGIFMERSQLMTCGILGIVKSGGAYLPLDTGYPPARLRYMLEDADVKIILTTRQNKGLLPKTNATVICLDEDWDSIALESPENPVNVNRSSDVAYIIYTSGSTGQPKGTLIPHRAVNRLVFNTNYVEVTEEDRIGHISNVSFDAATFELWGSLLHGASLIVLDKGLVLSPKEFISEIARKRVSTMFLTTALFNLMSNEDPAAFQTLNTLLVGGETLDPSTIRKVLETAPPRRLLNIYGPTETTTFAIFNVIKSVPVEAQSIPIGRPISNTTVYLLDQHLNPVPIGVAGEIYIGGPGLANGYLNRPELNAERFVSIPSHKLQIREQVSSNGKSIRLYRTGDIACYLPDGRIEFIGRKDNQIKLRGFRIELGEIEAVLNSHPAVKDGVVDVKVSTGGKKLVGYYIRGNEMSLAVGELRDFLRQKLPDFMIPSALIEVSEFKLNPNGKIDRRELPQVDEIPADSVNSSDGAKDELELKLTWIWKEALGLTTVGLNDNFFESGGHSLIAVRLFSEIEKILGCQLPLATLFQAPTISQLAELIRAGDWQSTWGSLIPMRPNGSKPPFFCVHAVGGNILGLRTLANCLSPDQPFYGLQSIGLDGKTAPLTNISEMADAYLKEIREIQPHGPYFLGGRSFGGTVVCEIARQLSEQGEETALLAIFDSYPAQWLKLCTADESRAYEKEFLRLRIKRHLAVWKELGMIEKCKYFFTKVNYKSRKYKNLLWQLMRKLGFGNKSSVNTTIRNIAEINYLAVKNYEPKPFPARVTFFCAREDVCPEESIIGWERLAEDGVDVIEVPGDHQTMMLEPYVQELAVALEKCIDRRIQADS